MKFAKRIINVQTRVKADADAISTDITLLECDVPDDVIADALVAGNSPRVHWQSGARANGVPRTAELSWADWIGKPRRSAVSKARDMTATEMATKALGDEAFKEQLLAELQRLAVISVMDDTADEPA